MKNGKWNYTENIVYTVALVKINQVQTPPLHWQNAFVGTERQVVEIMDMRGYRFLIDNEDGSGLRKIARGGGPDSYHADIGDNVFIRRLPEAEWKQWDPVLHNYFQVQGDQWSEKNFPEEFKKLKALRASFRKTKQANK